MGAFFETLKELIPDELVRTVLEEAKLKIDREYAVYCRGCLTDEEFGHRLYQLLPFSPFAYLNAIGICFPSMEYYWGSVIEPERYKRLMDDKRLFDAGSVPYSDAGTPWLCQYHILSQYKSELYWNGLLDLNNFLRRGFEGVQTKEEADADAKIRFFRLCNLMEFPLLQYYEPMPEKIDFPQISLIAHQYNDGGFVRLTFPFYCEKRVPDFEDAIGHTYRFHADNGIMAEITVEDRKSPRRGPLHEGRGFITDYTPNDHETLLSYFPNKDGTYDIDLFLNWKRGSYQFIQKNPRWREFWKWYVGTFQGGGMPTSQYTYWHSAARRFLSEEYPQCEYLPWD